MAELLTILLNVLANSVLNMYRGGAPNIFLNALFYHPGIFTITWPLNRSQKTPKPLGLHSNLDLRCVLNTYSTSGTLLPQAKIGISSAHWTMPVPFMPLSPLAWGHKVGEVTNQPSFPSPIWNSSVVRPCSSWERRVGCGLHIDNISGRAPVTIQVK